MINELIPYIIRLIAGSAIVILPYYFFLRNDPNLKLKRFYLISGIAASWIFPLLSIQRPEIIQTASPAFVIDPGTISSTVATSDSGFSLNWTILLVSFYLAGVAFIFFRNFMIMIKWNRLWKNRKDLKSGVAYTDSDTIFSLFSKIFVPGTLKDSKDIHAILIHEKAHVKQFHFIDLLISEFNLLFTWFNPFSWLISRMIKENHEHLADREVLASGVNPAHYRAQLVNQTLGVSVFRLSHQFNHSITKKRFEMMKKVKFSRSGLIKFIFLVPVILVTLGFVTGTSGQNGKVHGKVIFSDTNAPAHGASVIINQTTTGTITDKDGGFVLEMDGDPEIVISFVGYETKVVRASEASKAIIYLDPKIINLQPDETPKPPRSAEKVKDKKKKTETEELVFYVVEDMPKFNGGDPKDEFAKYIYEHLTYPEPARENGIQGNVFVQFRVNSHGKVDNVVVKKGVDPVLDKEAKRVIEASPDWTPGKQRGKAVAVQFVFPVRFSLEKN